MSLQVIKYYMKKNLLVLLIMLFTCTLLAAQDESQENEVSENTEEQKPFQDHLITMAGFSALQIDEEDFILSPSVNLQYMHIKNQEVEAKGPDAIVIGAGYSMDHFTEGLGPEKADTFHGINLMGNLVAGKNSFISMVAAGGEEPFASWKNFSGGLMYTRQLVKTDNVSFSAGLGVMAGDLGIKIKNYKIYVIPLPVFSFNYQNDIFAGGISMMGLPTISLTLFPKSMFRLKGSCGMAGFSSIRDLTFDAALVCYPLINTKVKELISVSAGVMNNVKSVSLKNKTKYGYQYYSAYGEINASFVVLRAGYNFDGVTRVDDKETGSLCKGLYASAQAMFMF